MKRQQIIEQGMRLLNDVREDEHFRTVDGRTLGSVRELVMLLETYQDEHFRHHVNEHRNDFAAWIEHSVGDQKLAERIRQAPTPVRIQQEIAARLEEIENELLSFEEQPVEAPPAQSEQAAPKSTAREKPKRNAHEDRPAPQPVKKPQALPEERETVKRDELLEEIERSIAQARAQLEIERAQEVREPEDLSGEPDDFEEEPVDEPVPKPEPVKRSAAKREGSGKEPKQNAQGSDFSLKDFFIGFAFGALIGGVLGAIIGLMLLTG